MSKLVSDLEIGKIKVAEEVYATIVAICARKVKGVAGLASTFNDGMSSFFGRKHDYAGVKVSFNHNGALEMTIYVMVTYGYRIPDVALRLQEKIKSTLVEFTEVEVEAIDIVVQEIVFDTIGPQKS